MPTNTTTADTIANELTRIADELTAAQADVAILERLRGAEARVKSLTIEHSAASAMQALHLAAEAKAQLEAKFDYLGGISVRDMTPDAQVIGSSFQITYGRLAWDMYVNKSVMQDESKREITPTFQN